MDTTEESPEQACHSLPCTIGYTGRAPVDAYFRPEPLSITSNAKNSAPFLAAAFRGRGLLTRVRPNDEGRSSSSVHGRVLHCSQRSRVIDADINENYVPVKITAAFEKFHEWHHTHLPSVVSVNDSQAGRLQISREWCYVSKALHSPVKCDQSCS